MAQEQQPNARENILSWDEYFMGLARLTSRRSKDPNTQVGAAIVNSKNRVVSTGYNGIPNGCPDDLIPWSRDDPEPFGNKYLYVCHAVLNAIINTNSADLDGCKIYVTLFPSNECAKAIIQAGIKEVIYLSDKNKIQKEWWKEVEVAKMLFKNTGVKHRRFTTERPPIVLELNEADGNQDN